MHNNMIGASLDDILTKYSRQEKGRSRENHTHLSHTLISRIPRQHPRKSSQEI